MSEKTTTLSFPIFPKDQKIFVQNDLKGKKINVMVSPNNDFVLIDVLIGFAKIGSGAFGIINSLSDVATLLRSLSLVKKSMEVIKKLQGDIEEISMTIHPRERRDVYDAFTENPFMWADAIGMLNVWGAKGFTLLITDESLEKSVLLNSALGVTYVVTEDGVKGSDNSVRLWNGGHNISGLNSSIPPSLVLMDEKLVMVYRHNKGNKLQAAEFTNGNFHNIAHNNGWLPIDANDGGVGLTVWNNQFVIVARDPHGEQMFAAFNKGKLNDINFTIEWMGPDIQGRPSATTIGESFIGIGKHYPGDAVMFSERNATKVVAQGNSMYNTVHSPAVHRFKGKVYMVYTNYHMMDLAVYNKGKWERTGTLNAQTSAGPALTVYNDRLYVFYRDYTGNSIFYMWTEDGITFKEPRSKYFGFEDIYGPPAASPMPGGKNGILVAGILNAAKDITSYINPNTSEAIVWKVLKPEE